MADICLSCNDIVRTFPDFRLSFSFSVREDELLSIIGPSGSGKSTVLRIICGLEKNDSGTVQIMGTDVTALPTERRRTAIVYSDDTLFPHMTVEQNIAYPMKNRHMSKEEATAEVRRLLETVNLSGHEKKRPSELSETEKLKAAIARALASNPDVLLLDQVLSSLDYSLRFALAGEIGKIQRKAGVTTIFVTDSPQEAMSISDRLIVMNNGKIEQNGTPEEVYRKPCSEFCARFTGECNILPYDVILKTLRVPETERSKVIYQCFGPEHRILFRPEDMVVNDMPGLPFPEFYPHLRFEDARIIRTEYLGKEYLVTASYDDLTIKVYTVYKPASETITAGIRMTKILEFNDGKLIRH